MLFSKKTNIKDLKIPSHVAIIMDGNARWSKSKGLPTSLGHKEGSKNVQKVAESAIELGIKYLTIYAFSAQNWDRPKDEVEYLMKLMDEYLDKETAPLIEKGVKIIISGDLSKLSSLIQEKIKKIEDLTKNNQSLTLNVAFSYGSREEITNSVKNIAIELLNNNINMEEIDEDLIAKNFYHQIPDPDLLIRTAGEYRISNFLLWQIAYSELYFTKALWPDFNKKELVNAIIEFNKRERRYGKR